MTKYCPQNERIRRAYFVYLRDAKGLSEASLDHIAKAIDRFEAYTGRRDFKRFHIEQAKAFKQHLTEQRNATTKEPLSKATLHATLAALKAFFVWLAGQAGYKSRISYADAEYFNLNLKDTRVAKASRVQRVPSLEQIRHVLNAMPDESDIEKRNRALIAFAILTGARDGAMASMKLKHIDLDQRLIEQDAREVRTKFSKTFPTYFFPVGDDIVMIVAGWVVYLRTEKLFGPDDPLFPATRVMVGTDGLFRQDGLDRRAWSNAGPIRELFKKAFEQAGLPYFNPHSFRKTLAQLGQRKCKSIEEMKAWSQNLGHDELMTTFSAYGNLSRSQQAEIMALLE